MSQYLSDVLKASPADMPKTLAAPEAEAEVVTASGGAGAPAPVLTEGDVKKPSKGKKLQAPKGDTSRKVAFSKAVQNVLASKMKECNVDAFDGREATIEMLSAVYRRGAGSYSAIENPGVSRHDWAMARVNAFASLLQGADDVSSAYTADYDLLPTNHPKSEMVLTAGANESSYDEELTVYLYESEEDYESQEHAIFSLAEFSGLGYETIPAIRAAWMRGIRNNENPFERAAVLASALYDSPDADLLPKKGIL